MAGAITRLRADGAPVSDESVAAKMGVGVAVVEVAMALQRTTSMDAPLVNSEDKDSGTMHDVLESPARLRPDSISQDKLDARAQRRAIEDAIDDVLTPRRAQIVREFLAADLPVTVLDDLSTGELGFIPGKVSFTRGTILDGSLLERIFDEHDVTGVVHLAAFGYAGVSVQRPLHAYEQNVDGTTVLLAAMQDRGVSKIVFSSSAAVYGTPDVDLVTEETPKAPESPYGESKLIGEWLLRDQGVATGLRHTSLRYFNVVL